MDRLNKATKSVSIGLSEALADIAELLGDKQGMSASKVIQEWMLRGSVDAVLELLEQGEISSGYAAEALNITRYDLHDLIRDRGLRIGLSEAESALTSKTPQRRNKAS